MYALLTKRGILYIDSLHLMPNSNFDISTVSLSTWVKLKYRSQLLSPLPPGEGEFLSRLLDVEASYFNLQLHITKSSYIFSGIPCIGPPRLVGGCWST